MRLSRYFLPVMKETPGDAQIVSHKLMLRAGLVRQTAAGIYAWLPLGLRVLKRIEQIVREEQDRAGAIEMLMPTIQSEPLAPSGRMMLMDRKCCVCWTGTIGRCCWPTMRNDHRDLPRRCPHYRDLPRTLYHIQWKFRNEVRLARCHARPRISDEDAIVSTSMRKA